MMYKGLKGVTKNLEPDGGLYSSLEARVHKNTLVVNPYLLKGESLQKSLVLEGGVGRSLTYRDFPNTHCLVEVSQ